MLWFWGTVAIVVALAVVAAWLYDRRGDRSGVSDRDRDSIQRSRDEAYRYRDDLRGKGGMDGGY
ncbi:hypothetical protein GA707_20295 [Nostocoides sp. F2B08]|uniref:hypothetical protein n=1 Tax=Nostocoides sp. F2B08 TaxID=2653936 RepID=UPI001263AAB2|nr:hypothetical protein [Tetrasphaera sp. F2B08]KAB7739550.1 hypothetical protein GA707_20295 [Tetrasphaera sp. F2B08]